MSEGCKSCAAVQAERDHALHRLSEAQAERDEWRKATDDLNAMWLAMRTERDAALAALDRVKALADQWAAADGEPATGHDLTVLTVTNRLGRQLRAAVEGGRS